MIDRNLFELQCTEVQKSRFTKNAFYISCDPARKGRHPLKDDRNKLKFFIETLGTYSLIVLLTIYDKKNSIF